ncbi:MAG: hypothetical protein H6566_11095 [Lewinellaceae bacterium]|nr:hypothetical protein [Lewinellaceae bacterium]
MEEKKFRIEKDGKELAFFYLTYQGEGKYKAEIHLGLIFEGEGKAHVRGYELSLDENKEDEAIELILDSVLRRTKTRDKGDIKVVSI